MSTWSKQKAYIECYLNERYLKTAEQYQTCLEETDHLTYEYNMFKKHILKPQELILQQYHKPSRKLTPAFNRDTVVIMATLRIVHTNNLTFILGIQNEINSHHFTFVAVIWPTNKDIGKRWKQELKFNTKLLVCEPYHAGSIDIHPGTSTHPGTLTSSPDSIQYLMASFQNVLIVQSSEWHACPKSIKQKANQLFNQQRYDQALTMYQYALCNCCELDPTHKKDKAILYSNSSACLYEMGLYYAAIRYSNVSIRLDPTYAKSYWRKVNSLLELGIYGEVPSCLLGLKAKTGCKDLELLQVKYSGYLANAIGIYNWKDMVRPVTGIHSFGEYFSQKISYTDQCKRSYYSAKTDIHPTQLILISKPLANIRSSGQTKKSFSSFFQQVKRNASLQKEFYEQIRSLPCSCHSGAGIDSKGQDQSCKMTHMEDKQLANKIQKCAIMQKFIDKLDTQINYGIWKHFFYFQHNCQPNCSFVHLKKYLAVFAARPIKQGEFLSVDYVLDVEPDNRKETVKRKLGMTCNCQLCSFNHWPQTFGDDFTGMFSQLESLQSAKLKKSFAWNILCSRASRQGILEPNSRLPLENILFRYIQEVEIDKDTNWEDVLNLVGLMRTEDNPDIYQRLKRNISDFIQKYLKLNSTQTQAFLKEIE